MRRPRSHHKCPQTFQALLEIVDLFDNLEASINICQIEYGSSSRSPACLLHFTTVPSVTGLALSSS